MPIGRRDRETEHQRHLTMPATHGGAGRIDGDAGIERVENGLYQDGVHTSLEQRVHLLVVGSAQHRCVQGGSRPRRHGADLTRRSHRTDDIAGHGVGGVGVCQLPCYLTGSQVNLTAICLHAEVGKGDTLRIEGIGLYELGARLKIFTVDVGHHIGTGEAQQVVAAGQRHRMRLETLATEVVLRQPVALYHRAHAAIQHQHTLRSLLLKRRAGSR